MVQAWRSQWRVFGFLMPFYWPAWPLVFWCVASEQSLYKERLRRVLRFNAVGDISIAVNGNTACSQLYEDEDEDEDDGIGIGDGVGADCINTQTLGTLFRTNNGHTVVNADVDPDADASTFNSSRARLNLPTCASLKFAGL